jgi:hypothetical protein
MNGSAAGHTTTTDSCSQHTGKGRRAATNNVELVADQSDRPARPRLPTSPMSPEREGSRQGRTPSFISRQRLALHQSPARARLPLARHPTPAHPALPSPHQRQGRALHPDPASRMGLRATVSDQYTPNQRTRPLARPLQLHPTPRHPQPQTARHAPDKRD